MGFPLSNEKLRAGLTDVFAGTICSILSIAYCLSYAALIFTGPLQNLLAYGIAVTFLSAAVGGSIVAFRSSLPFAVAGPDSSTSVVLAALVATVVQRLLAGGGSDLLGPTLIAMSLTTMLTGLLLCVLGFTHAGRAIRFVPYPVIGGFLGATGWLMITGGIGVVAGQRTDAGQSAVAKESGKRKTAQSRWGCNKRLRVAFSRLADSTRHWHPWAEEVYARARARGQDHPHAIRTLGRAWIRVTSVRPG